jgi:thiol-disulfide isomerase/thioredoxin
MARRVLLGTLSLALILAAAATPSAVTAGAKPGGRGATAAGAPAREPADVRAILGRVADRYRDLDAYHLEGTLRIEISAETGIQTLDAPFVLAAARPGRVRDELRHPQAGMVMVSDGRQTWNYLAALGQFTRKPAPGDSSLPAGMLASQIFALYRDLPSTDSSARVVREEPLELAGAMRPCWVIEARFATSKPSDPPRLFWVDQERAIILQQQASTMLGDGGKSVRQAETLRYTRVSLNQPVADEVFTFEPPQGAREVDEFRAGPQHADLSGKPASDFTLADLQGRKHTLSAQRGKVVMLDFWASWCGPCRMQMPRVEKLYRELKPKGLVVYAINMRESPAIARRYLERNKYTTTTLLDQQGEVSERYQVAGIPSLVVIDRQGRIAAHFVGVRTEEDLREAIRKAGLQ